VYIVELIAIEARHFPAVPGDALLKLPDFFGPALLDEVLVAIPIKKDRIIASLISCEHNRSWAHRARADTKARTMEHGGAWSCTMKSGYG
jgi:hypothetical protein